MRRSASDLRAFCAASFRAPQHPESQSSTTLQPCQGELTPKRESRPSPVSQPQPEVRHAIEHENAITPLDRTKHQRARCVNELCSGCTVCRVIRIDAVRVSLSFDPERPLQLIARRPRQGRGRGRRVSDCRSVTVRHERALSHRSDLQILRKCLVRPPRKASRASAARRDRALPQDLEEPVPGRGRTAMDRQFGDVPGATTTLQGRSQIARRSITAAHRAPSTPRARAQLCVALCAAAAERRGGSDPLKQGRSPLACLAAAA